MKFFLPVLLMAICFVSVFSQIIPDELYVAVAGAVQGQMWDTDRVHGNGGRNDNIEYDGYATDMCKDGFIKVCDNCEFKGTEKLIEYGWGRLPINLSGCKEECQKDSSCFGIDYNRGKCFLVTTDLMLTFRSRDLNVFYNIEWEAFKPCTTEETGDWLLRADGTKSVGADAGCSKNSLKGKTVKFTDGFKLDRMSRCEAFCSDYNYLSFHANHYCGCYDSCDFTRPASDYGSKAKIYQFSSYWVLTADGINKAEAGCSENLRGKYYNSQTLRKCQSRCLIDGYNFIQHHNNGFCGCFKSCDYAKPASSYGARAKVYVFQKPKCADDPNWRDNSYGGTGTAVCVDMKSNPSWCTNHGDYSTEARRACPVSCGVCKFAVYDPWSPHKTNWNCMGSDEKAPSTTIEYRCKDECSTHLFAAFSPTQKLCRCYNSCSNGQATSQGFGNKVFMKSSAVVHVIVGNKNTNKCDAYLTKEECKEYATDTTSVGWGKVAKWTNHAKGCFLYGGKAFFNEDIEGGKNTDGGRPICKMAAKKAPVSVTPTCSFTKVGTRKQFSGAERRVASSGMTLQTCKDKCLAASDCYGIDVHTGGGTGGCWLTTGAVGTVAAPLVKSGSAYDAWMKICTEQDSEIELARMLKDVLKNLLEERLD